MRLFDQWVLEPVTPANQLPELPDGVYEVRPGCYAVECRSCGNWFPMEWDLAEDTYESHYCNGSDRCQP